MLNEKTAAPSIFHLENTKRYKLETQKYSTNNRRAPNADAQKGINSRKMPLPNVKSDVQRANNAKRQQESAKAQTNVASKPSRPNENVTARKRVTREEFEAILRKRQEQKRVKMRARLEYFLALAVIFLIAFTVMAGLFVGIFFINLTSHEEPDTSNYSFILSDYAHESDVSLGSIVGEDGKRYYNFSQIADFFDFAMIGSIDNMKYIIKGSENETVSFYPDADSAHVNDVYVRTDGKSFYDNGDLFVPESFIKDNLRGLDIKTDSGAKTVKISRIMLNSVDSEGKITDGHEPMYEDISFALKALDVTASIPEDDSAVVVPAFSFASDVSAYEEYMNPGSTIEFLTLVNKDNVLKENYIPTGLTKLSYGEGLLLKDYAANAFEAMLTEAQACGITGLTATRAYVSYSDTLSAYNAEVERNLSLLGREQAKRFASEVVGLPGTDEHQTGLAVDLALTSGSLDNSAAYHWLTENAEKFGFVLRYPADKVNVTGHSYNANQFRYVGRYHAVRINDLEMTLDEYCTYLGI